VEDARLEVEPEPDAPVANAQPPLRWLDVRQTQDIAMLIGSITIEGFTYALTDLPLQAARLS